MNDWRCDWKGYFYIREAKERFDLNHIYSKLYIAFLIATNQNFPYNFGTGMEEIYVRGRGGERNKNT